MTSTRGFVDHRVGIPDDELLRYWTRVMDTAGAMLIGRRTYELMEGAWPQVVHDPKAKPADRTWARKLEAKPKYVVSTTRHDFPRSNTHHLQGDLARSDCFKFRNKGEALPNDLLGTRLRQGARSATSPGRADPAAFSAGPDGARLGRRGAIRPAARLTKDPQSTQQR